MTEPDAQDPQPTDDDLNQLFATLTALDLPPAQRRLLDSILSIASEVTYQDESLDAQFAGSFAAGQAAVIANYSSAASSYLVSRSPGSGHVFMVSRLISQ